MDLPRLLHSAPDSTLTNSAAMHSSATSNHFWVVMLFGLRPRASKTLQDPERVVAHNRKGPSYSNTAAKYDGLDPASVQTPTTFLSPLAVRVSVNRTVKLWMNHVAAISSETLTLHPAVAHVLDHGTGLCMARLQCALDLLGPRAIQILFRELISQKCFVRVDLQTKF